MHAPHVDFAATSGTTYQIAMVGAVTVADGQYVINLNQSYAPIFTRQPPISVEVIATSNVTFGAYAIGSPVPTFQWKLNGTNVSGATATNFTISSMQETNGGDYTLVASNTNGTATSAVCQIMYFPSGATPIATNWWSSDQFSFTLNHVAGYNYVVQASTNLVDWTDVETRTVPFTFTASPATNYLHRFFRTKLAQ